MIMYLCMVCISDRLSAVHSTLWGASLAVLMSI